MWSFPVSQAQFPSSLGKEEAAASDSHCPALFLFPFNSGGQSSSPIIRLSQDFLIAHPI